MLLTALPLRMPLVRVAPASVRPGVWVAGDFTDLASIEGAMDGGERIAAAIPR